MAVYLRRTVNEDGNAYGETLGNLSALPPDLVALMPQRLAQNERLSGIGEKTPLFSIGLKPMRVAFLPGT